MNNLFDKIMAGVMSALIVGCFTGWVQINSSISMLEMYAGRCYYDTIFITNLIVQETAPC